MKARLMARVVLIHFAREETNTLRACDFLATALDNSR